MQARAAPPRDRLLAAAVDYVVANGFSNLSLREVAAAIGTSHRMLIYHFGSKEGLLVAIIRSVEAAQRDFFAQLLLTQPELPPGDGIRLMWRHFTDPHFAPHERLFFEIYAQALQGRPGTTGLLEDVVDAWVEPIAAYAVERGVSIEAARADARLGVAVIRGLLLDLLATGNRSAVDAALERYIAQYEALLTITVCDDQTGTTESVCVAADWVRQGVPSAVGSPPQVTEGEVLVTFAK